MNEVVIMKEGEWKEEVEKFVNRLKGIRQGEQYVVRLKLNYYPIKWTNEDVKWVLERVVEVVHQNPNFFFQLDL